MTKEEIVYELLEQYNKECYPTPKIDDIKFVHDNNSWGELDISNLYNHKYVLELYPGMFMLNKYFVNQIMYHEFTHIYDSTKFQHLDLASFNDIMQIYSEIHASEIETNLILRTQTPPHNLDDIVIRELKLPLRRYMNSRLNEVKNQYACMPGIVTKNNTKYNYKHLYYFLGAVLSLKRHGINYEYDFSHLLYKFGKLFNNIADYILNDDIYDNYNPDTLIQMHREIVATTKDFIKGNNKEIVKPSDLVTFYMKPRT